MDKGLIGKTLRKDSKECVEKLSKLSIDEVKKLHEFIDNGYIRLLHYFKYLMFLNYKYNFFILENLIHPLD